MRAYPQCDAAPAAASSRLLHSVAEPAPRRVTPDPLCRPGAGTGSRTALPLEEACTPSRSHPERGCRLLGKGKNLWRFSSVFLPWRAMRLTDISKCLFPECCDETKPALTGTCSLFPSWSLICHCWGLEDLNGSETDTSLGFASKCSEESVCVKSVFSPCWIYWGLEEIFIVIICQQSWSRLQPLHGIL